MKTKKVCPLPTVYHCVEGKCAWYVTERSACAVKVIAAGKSLASR